MADKKEKTPARPSIRVSKDIFKSYSDAAKAYAGSMGWDKVSNDQFMKRLLNSSMQNNVGIRVKIRYMVVGQHSMYDAYKTVVVPFLVDGMSLCTEDDGDTTTIMVRAERLSYYCGDNKAYLVDKIEFNDNDDDEYMRKFVVGLRWNGWTITGHNQAMERLNRDYGEGPKR